MANIITVTPSADYESRKTRLSEQMKRANGVRLSKENSNLFRVREDSKEQPLSVRDFNHVLAINLDEGWVEVEGMTTYDDFVRETLPHGVMPAVVPQLKTITIGGAVAGVGIEANSFRYGLVHETVLSMEVLLADGSVVTCNSHEHSDLFYAFPNSYGTLGYALKLTVKIIPVKPFVALHHERYNDTASYFAALEKACGRNGNDPSDTAAKADFVDGMMISPNELYLMTGTFVDAAPFTSDYTFMQRYYQSIKTRSDDYLSIHDFLWRWDTDWFWCSVHFGVENNIVRRLFGRERLNSATYWKMRNFAQRHASILKLASGFKQREPIIQDIEVPVANAPAFAEFFAREIGITPVWICPIRPYDDAVQFDLYKLDPKKLYINFGFWDSVASAHEPGYYNRMIEDKVTELGGNKSLYSDSYYSEEAFWKIYDKSMYDALKAKYDPRHKLKDLFEKAVKKG